MAITIITFANSDGGDIAIGLKDKGAVTGIDSQETHINELLRAPFDYCVSSVRVDTRIIDCVDEKRNPNHILLMHAYPSTQLHVNQADEVHHNRSVLHQVRRKLIIRHFLLESNQPWGIKILHVWNLIIDFWIDPEQYKAIFDEEWIPAPKDFDEWLEKKIQAG